MSSSRPCRSSVGGGRAGAEAMDTEPTPHFPGHVAGYWKRHWARIFRWLHIYVSMASFGILFFFAATGLTLNHADGLFGSAPVTSRQKGKVDPKLLAAGAGGAVAKLEIVEHLRRVHGVKGLVGEFRVEDGRAAILFKGPGYTADAQVDLGTGAYELSETRMGFVAVINDLHKGRDSGPGWSLVVDLSAGLMIAVSLTGMVLVYFVKRHVIRGLIVAVLGAGASYLAYAWLVP